MGHVGTVIALPLHDERLRPDSLLWWRDLDGNIENPPVCGMLEPAVIHYGYAVSRTENDVDEPFGRPDLGQPMREHQLGLVPSRGTRFQQALHIAWPCKD